MRNKLSFKTLLEKFPVPEKSDWYGAARAETGSEKGLEDLNWGRADDLKFLPYYDRSDAGNTQHIRLFNLPAANGHEARHWLNIPAVTVAGEAAANAAALQHLQHGVDGVFFQRSGKTDVVALLRDIQVPVCRLIFSVNDTSTAERIIDHCLQQYPEASLPVSFVWPDGDRTMGVGEPYLNAREPAQLFGLQCRQTSDPADEIAHALLSAVRLTERLISHGHPVASAFRHIFFSLEADQEFFITYARFKVMRMLWFQVVRAFGEHRISYGDIHLHAQCTPWQGDDYQPHASLLRHSFAASAAVCGGCNSLSVVPDANAGGDGHRTARNVSHILKHEARLHLNADPLAGAYFVDELVHQLASAAWGKFTNEY